MMCRCRDCGGTLTMEERSADIGVCAPCTRDFDCARSSADDSWRSWRGVSEGIDGGVYMDGLNAD